MPSLETTLRRAQGPSSLVVGPRASLALALLCVTHFTVDLYSSALGALQPYLASRLGLSLPAAASLGSLLIFSSSVAQPLYGYLSDRFPSPAFTVLAPAVASVFISSLIVAPSYAWLVLLVLSGGAGVAAFHPQGSVLASRVYSQGSALSMGLFVSAGALGYALGPAAFTAFLTRWGAENGFFAALPGLVCTLLLLPVATTFDPPHRARPRLAWASLGPVRKPLSILYFTVFLRSVVQIGFAQFLPLYLSRERGFPLGAAGYTLSSFLAAGALGGIFGGRLADRFGGRNVILLSMLLSAPFFMLFFLTSGWLASACLVLGGFVLLSTIPVNIVMAQRLVPAAAGTVSALMMGFAWGMAGFIFVPLIGFVGEISSLGVALSTLVLCPLIGAVLAWRLPR